MQTTTIGTVSLDPKSRATPSAELSDYGGANTCVTNVTLAHATRKSTLRGYGVLTRPLQNAATHSLLGSMAVTKQSLSNSFPERSANFGANGLGSTSTSELHTNGRADDAEYGGKGHWSMAVVPATVRGKTLGGTLAHKLG
jgi:hypothetical protein